LRLRFGSHASGYNPNRTLYRAVYARVLFAEGKTDEALAEFKGAVADAYFPWDATDTLYFWMQACQSAGRRDEAIEVGKKILALWPNSYWADEARKIVQPEAPASEGQAALRSDEFRVASDE
jgi:tetratricopeptide (TPR) repeat protein